LFWRRSAGLFFVQSPQSGGGCHGGSRRSSNEYHFAQEGRYLEPGIKKNDGDDVVLSKVGPENWKITSPKPLIADNDMVSIITFDLSPLKAEQVIEEKASDLKAYGLAPPAVELFATIKDGKPTKLSDRRRHPGRRHGVRMVQGDPRVYTINSSLKANFNKSLADIRDKRLVPLIITRSAKWNSPARS